MMKPWLRQHIHNDAHYASLMAVIREKEETLKQRVIRAGGFFGYGRVMVVGGGRRLWHPLSAKPAELMRLSSRTGCHSLLWLMGCTQWTRSKTNDDTNQTDKFLSEASCRQERRRSMRTGWTALHQKPAKRPTRGFLAGLALLKTNPAEAYRLAAWADDEIILPVTQISSKKFEAQSAPTGYR